MARLICDAQPDGPALKAAFQFLNRDPLASGSMAVVVALQVADWLWLHFQPKRALSLWYQRRFAGGGLRMRRIGIVALARRLLIALWRYLAAGVIPEDARLIASQI